jgi:hypothetical protein
LIGDERHYQVDHTEADNPDAENAEQRTGIQQETVEGNYVRVGTTKGEGIIVEQKAGAHGQQK